MSPTEHMQPMIDKGLTQQISPATRQEKLWTDIPKEPSLTMSRSVSLWFLPVMETTQNTGFFISSRRAGLIFQ
ncbi:hypothetical protein TNCV_2034111 [Trichonephila clavipes]|nr:hypothetical protein TNCV_2034111 [Trichonephila clavipes]